MLVSWSSVNKTVLVKNENGDFWSCGGLWVFAAPFSSSLHPHPHFVHAFENCYFSVVCILVLLFIRFRLILKIFLSPFSLKTHGLNNYCLVGSAC